MLAHHKTVNSLPLENLWDEAGSIAVEKRGFLNPADLQLLLQQGPVQFVLADVGQKLQWLDVEQCFVFWKNEVKIHLAGSTDRINLAGYPDGYAYLASEWRSQNDSVVVLLEKIH